MIPSGVVLMNTSGEPLVLTGTKAYTVGSTMVGTGVKLPQVSKFIHINADVEFTCKLSGMDDLDQDITLALKTNDTLYVEVKSISAITSGLAGSIIVFY